MSLKFHVQRVRAELELRQSEFWKNKFMFCKDDYPNLLILVELCLVIPCQTACCERGNSWMNRIMTDWRSTLNVSTIDELMRIAISGPSHEDYTAVLAVGRWLEESERSRRPTLMDWSLPSMIIPTIWEHLINCFIILNTTRVLGILNEQLLFAARSLSHTKK